MQPIPSQTEARGIFQADIILRTALKAGIDDLRANPWLLDYVFASLTQDVEDGQLVRVDTTKDYGEKEIDKAKRWFLKTDIPVMVAPRIDEARIPSITIKLAESTEAEVTLGDIHYQTTESTPTTTWPPLAGPFVVDTYDPSTGIVGIPASVSDNFIIVPGMVLVDAKGQIFTIQSIVQDQAEVEVQTADDLAATLPMPLDGSVVGTTIVPPEDNDTLRVVVSPATGADFTRTLLKGAQPSLVTQLESVRYRETYQIGVHVASEPVYLTWLHSIIVFILLRYKQDLLEARGFEQSVPNSTDFDRNDNFPEDQNVFSRYINVTGYVRQYWPKRIDRAITSVTGTIQIEGAGNMPPDVDLDEQLWVGDLDSLGTKS